MDRERKLTAVLDTNVLLGKDRNRFLRAARSNVFTLVWSDFIEHELVRKMWELNWKRENALLLAGAITRLAVRVDHNIITGGNYDEWLHDLDDHPIMATAIQGGVDYLVTNNTKDFPPKKQFAGIIVITPDAFLRLLE